MRRLLIVIAALACLAVIVVACANSTSTVGGNSTLTAMQDVPKEGKEQPKLVTLGKDSQSDKYGEAAFNHENHTTKNYSVDGKSVIACVECHHTDQPASALQPPLKTSERDKPLTAALLATPDAKPVKTCRACHLQAGDDSAPLPAVTYAGKTTPTKLTNEVAYHTNCEVCHDKALAARPVLKGKIPGTNDCLNCHKPVS
ncbi:MAG: cytochrome c family protein [Acidobacteriota bacterium]|nr:cytochrome c family protein [Acidobacteriota bacterium]